MVTVRRFLSLLLLAIATLIVVAVRPAIADSGQQWTVADYQIKLGKQKFFDTKPPEQTLTVTRGGKVIYRLKTWYIWVKPSEVFGGLDDHVAVGGDILGLGVPTVVIKSGEASMHCACALTILKLGATFRALPPIDMTDDQPVRLLKVPNNPVSAIGLDDYTFTYWHASRPESPNGKIVLSYNSHLGRYATDASLMSVPSPSPAVLAEWRSRAVSAQEEDPNECPRELSQPVFDLIYTGNMKAAKAFLESAWEGENTARDEYWSDLTTCQLRRSPYWPTVAKINGLPADPPVASCQGE